MQERTISEAKRSPPPAPTIEDVLAAEHEEQVTVLVQFIRVASVDELLVLADAWKDGNAFSQAIRARSMLLFERLMELAPEKALAMGRPFARINLTTFCYECWARHDPTAAVEAAEKEPETGLPAVIEEVSKRDLGLALSLLERHPGIPEVARAVLGQLARSDPKRALELAGKLAGPSRHAAIAAILSTQAQTDFESAFEEAQQLESVNERNTALSSLIDGLLDSDPGQAEKHIRILEPSKTRQALFAKLIGKRVTDDARAALTWAETLPKGSERQAAIAHAVRALTKNEPEKLFEYLDQVGWDQAVPNPADTRRSGSGWAFQWEGSLILEVQNALKGMGEEKPERVMAILGKLPDLSSSDAIDVRKQVLEKLAPQWIEKHSEEGMHWLEKIPEESIRKQIGRTLASEIAPEHLDWLKQQVTDLTDETMRTELLRGVAGQLAADDPGETLAWANQLPEKERAKVMEIAINAMSDLDAATKTVATMPPGPERSTAVHTLVDRLGEQDFDRAYQWFMDLPDSDLSPPAYGRLAGHWYEEDAQEAAAWISQLPPGPDKDFATAEVTQKIIRADNPDLEAGLVWAQSITDETQRHKWIQDTLEVWANQAPLEAIPRIEQSVLPAAVKQRLFERAKPR